MNRTEFTSMTFTAITAAVVVLTGQHLASQVESATEPVIACLLGHDPSSVIALIGAVTVASALAGFVITRIGRWIRHKWGELPAEMLATLLLGLAAVLLFYSAIPGALLLIWLAALAVGALLAMDSNRGS